MRFFISLSESFDSMARTWRGGDRSGYLFAAARASYLECCGPFDFSIVNELYGSHCVKSTRVVSVSWSQLDSGGNAE